MEARWVEIAKTFGSRPRQAYQAGPAYPKGQPNASRRDAWPPDGGRPGSSLAFLQKQLLDANNIVLGVLNPTGDNGASSQNRAFGAGVATAMNRWIEAELLDVLAREGVGAIVFSPLAQGLLTDRYLNGVPADSRVRRGNYFGEDLLSDVPGARASLEISGEFEPMVASDASRRLFEHYVACARSLGQTVESVFAGGCADSGFAASVGAPTLCAVGPIGGRAHSPEEYLDVDSIVPRAQALALAIMRLDAL